MNSRCQALLIHFEEATLTETHTGLAIYSLHCSLHFNTEKCAQGRASQKV